MVDAHGCSVIETNRVNNNDNNSKYLFTHKSIIFKNAVIDFKWVLTT